MVSDMVITGAEITLHIKSCNLKEFTVDNLCDFLELPTKVRNDFAVGCLLKQIQEIIGEE